MKHRTRFCVPGGSWRGWGRLAFLLTAAAFLGMSGPPAVAAIPPKGEGRSRSTAGAVHWHIWTRDEVRRELTRWLDQTHADSSIRRQVGELCPAEGTPAGSEQDPLTLVAQCFALADPRAHHLVELAGKPHVSARLEGQEWLSDGKLPPFVAKNLQLFYGRWLAQELLFDEAQEQLGRLSPQEVVDPAALLFYQAVMYHALLDREQGLQAVNQIIASGEQCPKRYVALAKLMQADLEGLKEESLDHIARRMNDIHRRLELGRAGPHVRKVEKGVIDSLDKMIKKIEDQQRQQQQMAGGAGRQPNRPAEESRPLEGKGPGDVVKRNIGSKSGWGDLPPKEREEAIQQIGRDFPPHYREIIEQYFRKLATEEGR